VRADGAQPLQVSLTVLSAEEDEEERLHGPAEGTRRLERLLQRDLQPATAAVPRHQAPEEHPVQPAVVVADDDRDSLVSGTRRTVTPHHHPHARQPFQQRATEREPGKGTAVNDPAVDRQEVAACRKQQHCGRKDDANRAEQRRDEEHQRQQKARDSLPEKRRHLPSPMAVVWAKLGQGGGDRQRT
jgi:hypothetical protein